MLIYSGCHKYVPHLECLTYNHVYHPSVFRIILLKSGIKRKFVLNKRFGVKQIRYPQSSHHFIRMCQEKFLSVEITRSAGAKSAPGNVVQGHQWCHPAAGFNRRNGFYGAAFVPRCGIKALSDTQLRCCGPPWSVSWTLPLTLNTYPMYAAFFLRSTSCTWA